MKQRRVQKGKVFWWILLLLVVVPGAVYYFFILETDKPATADLYKPLPAAPIVPAETKPEPDRPETAPSPEPVADEEVVTAEPLPSLADSDAAALAEASGLMGEDPVRAHFVTEGLISRLVATIDALTLDGLPENILPVRAPVGAFEATPGSVSTQINPETGLPEQRYTLDPANYQRYTAQVEILEAINTADLVESYRKYYPLLQQSYRELGYPDGEFSERLSQVIDHLLATPEPQRPVRLVKPEAFYKFEDPSLETLSAGQRLLIRIGPANAARVKAKLTEFKAALQTQRE
jgi:hypothetical protein